MKITILYDSAYGNTEKIVYAIKEAISGDVTVSRPHLAKIGDLQKSDLLIVGSPTQGGRATPSLMELLSKLPTNGLKDVLVATFDTRFAEHEQKFFLKLLMKVIGYAAPKIAKTLEYKGAKLIVPPEGFIVEGTEGPLKKGELERVREWAKVFSGRKKN